MLNLEKLTRTFDWAMASVAFPTLVRHPTRLGHQPPKIQGGIISGRGSAPVFLPMGWLVVWPTSERV